VRLIMSQSAGSGLANMASVVSDRSEVGNLCGNLRSGGRRENADNDGCDTG